VSNVVAEFGVLAEAGLAASYGCTDLSACPETTKVKYLRYANDAGEVVDHRYAAGDPSVPVSDVSAGWGRVNGFMTNLAGCGSGGSIASDPGCVGGDLP
jgi:hypothetical protein